MSSSKAMAELFVSAFKALEPRVQAAVLARLIDDAEVDEDLADTLVLESRRGQPHEPLRDVLKHGGISFGRSHRNQ